MGKSRRTNGAASFAPMAASALDGPLRALSASQGTAFATFVQALVASIESSHAADRADLLARVDAQNAELAALKDAVKAASRPKDPKMDELGRTVGFLQAQVQRIEKKAAESSSETKLELTKVAARQEQAEDAIQTLRSNMDNLAANISGFSEEPAPPPARAKSTPKGTPKAAPKATPKAKAAAPTATPTAPTAEGKAGENKAAENKETAEGKEAAEQKEPADGAAAAAAEERTGETKHDEEKEEKCAGGGGAARDGGGGAAGDDDEKEAGAACEDDEAGEEGTAAGIQLSGPVADYQYEDTPAFRRARKRWHFAFSRVKLNLHLMVRVSCCMEAGPTACV